MQLNADFERISLCSYGHGHSCVGCSHAHSLSELLPPNERVVRYPEVWDRGLVHRWYGQSLSADALGILVRYWEAAPLVDNRPPWVVGLYLFTQRAECCAGMAYPWDFGLREDLAMLRRLRGSQELPFRPYADLWDRLEARRAVMAGGGMHSLPQGYFIPYPRRAPSMVLGPPSIQLISRSRVASPSPSGSCAMLDSARSMPSSSQDHALRPQSAAVVYGRRGRTRTRLPRRARYASGSPSVERGHTSCHGERSSSEPHRLSTAMD